jgi:hypothetical protein
MRKDLSVFAVSALLFSTTVPLFAHDEATVPTSRPEPVTLRAPGGRPVQVPPRLLYLAGDAC